MWLIVLLYIYWIKVSFSSIPNVNHCYFDVFYSNGSRTSCLDQLCNEHLDLVSMGTRRCRTNILSLRFSSYSTYRRFLLSTSLKVPLSSFFSMARPNLQRHLHIEFLSPFPNNDSFTLDELKLLTGAVSNIDIYEFVFHGNIARDNTTLFIDRDVFLSDEQSIIDTLRLRFICHDNQRVEWTVIRSIQHLPNSPCPKQIQFLQSDNFAATDQFSLLFLISFITFIGLAVTIKIFISLLQYNHDIYCRLENEYMLKSQTENKAAMIARF